MGKTTRDVQFENFRAALASLVQDRMAWPYSDVSRDSDEAIDASWAIAEKHVAALWADMGAEGEGGGHE